MQCGQVLLKHFKNDWLQFDIFVSMFLLPDSAGSQTKSAPAERCLETRGDSNRMVEANRLSVQGTRLPLKKANFNFDLSANFIRRLSFHVCCHSGKVCYQRMKLFCSRLIRGHKTGLVGSTFHKRAGRALWHRWWRNLACCALLMIMKSQSCYKARPICLSTELKFYQQLWRQLLRYLTRRDMHISL